MIDVLGWVATTTGARDARRGARIQSLWAGYGEIFRVHLTGARYETAIVKWVRPPLQSGRERADASHLRKRRSYDVESAWYRSYATRCDDACRVASLIDERVADGERLLLLEDLDAAGFPERRRAPDGAAIERCLAWLAALHARFVGVPPVGLWERGTYWHLGTRRDELGAIEDASLREAATPLDARLQSATFQTILHGDAKPANFCFAPAAYAVAAVDFQYAGGGCGMKDVAYLLHREDADAPAVEARLLDVYFGRLRSLLSPAVDGAALEAEWRGLYPVAVVDFCRFLAGWAPDHWRRDTRSQRRVRDVLRTLK